MSYSNTVRLEGELAPIVADRIRAVREERDLPWADAIQAVAAEWYQAALDEGFSTAVARDASHFVQRVGVEVKSGHYLRRA